MTQMMKLKTVNTQKHHNEKDVDLQMNSLGNERESYTNSKNKIRPAKEVKTVDCKCRFNCRTNITEEQQRSLFSEYYSLEDFKRQKDYLNSFITEEPVQWKQKRKEDSGIDKTVSRKYVLPNGKGEFFRVCLPLFCSTFSISKQLTITILSQRSPNG